ncbi:MAG TPA: DMT family transporter [bacterium]|nr:DMT family transporter [bacterium]
MPTLRIAADASLIGVAVIWGATFPLAKVVLRSLGPFSYLGLRFAIAGVLLLPLARRDLKRLRLADLGRGWLTGAVLFAAYALQTLGLAQTTASKAGLITGLNVVIVPVLLFVWIRRVPSAPTAAGVALAACGLWLLSWQGERLSAGDALVLGCAVALALHLILVGRFAGALPPAGFAFLQVSTVAVLGGAVGLVWEPRPIGVLPGTIASVVFMAVGATFAAYLAQSWAQRTVSPTRTGLLFAVEPVAAVGFSVAWLGEALGTRQALGAAAILAGVALGEAGRARDGA